MTSSIDPLYGEPLVAALAACAPAARVVSGGSERGSDRDDPALAALRPQHPSHGNRAVPIAVKRAAYERMVGHVLAGELAPAAHDTIPMERFADAFERQLAHPHAKLILVPPGLAP